MSIALSRIDWGRVWHHKCQKQNWRVRFDVVVIDGTPLPLAGPASFSFIPLYGVQVTNMGANRCCSQTSVPTPNSSFSTIPGRFTAFTLACATKTG